MEIATMLVRLADPLAWDCVVLMNLRKPETSDVHLRSRLMRFSCVCAYLQSERDRERERERSIKRRHVYPIYRNGVSRVVARTRGIVSTADPRHHAQQSCSIAAVSGRERSINRRHVYTVQEWDLSIAGMCIQYRNEIYQSPACVSNPTNLWYIASQPFPCGPAWSSLLNCVKT